MKAGFLMTPILAMTLLLQGMLPAVSPCPMETHGAPAAAAASAPDVASGAIHAHHHPESDMNGTPDMVVAVAAAPDASTAYCCDDMSSMQCATGGCSATGATTMIPAGTLLFPTGHAASRAAARHTGPHYPTLSFSIYCPPIA